MLADDKPRVELLTAYLGLTRKHSDSQTAIVRLLRYRCKTVSEADVTVQVAVRY